LISEKAVHSKSDETLRFFEAADPNLSSLLDNGTEHKSHYQVKTISLEDLLVGFEAPLFIDFLSIDTEGTEYEILRNFPFNRYRFGAICVEHNFSKHREDVSNLLGLNGYKKVNSDLSWFDDWYVDDKNSRLDIALVTGSNPVSPTDPNLHPLVEVSLN